MRQIKHARLSRRQLLRDQTRARDESEVRYRTLFESIDEGFCIVEVIFDAADKPIDYRFLEINPSFEKQTGLVKAQGRTMREMAPNIEEHWFAIYGQVATTGEPTRFENESNQLNRWFDVYAFRFGAPENRQVAILFSDITERKRAEREIERLNSALTARAEELESANEELAAFNYTVAHDLRQPLNLMSMYCQSIMAMCGDHLAEPCLGYVEHARRATLRMNDLISALLNFSRMGTVQPHRELVDLSLMAHEIAKALGLTEPERQVDFRIAQGVETDGDAKLLRAVLENILGNAWKYTSGRENAVVEFGVKEVDGERTYFVRDNGPGFDPADAEKIFAPFKRLREAESSPGFGIGLATVQRIVGRHGGKVWAEGVPGEGATFYFTLNEK